MRTFIHTSSTRERRLCCMQGEGRNYMRDDHVGFFVKDETSERPDAPTLEVKKARNEAIKETTAWKTAKELTNQLKEDYAQLSPEQQKEFLRIRGQYHRDVLEKVDRLSTDYTLQRFVNIVQPNLEKIVRDLYILRRGGEGQNAPEVRPLTDGFASVESDNTMNPNRYAHLVGIAASALEGVNEPQKNILKKQVRVRFESGSEEISTQPGVHYDRIILRDDVTRKSVTIPFLSNISDERIKLTIASGIREILESSDSTTVI